MQFKLLTSVIVLAISLGSVSAAPRPVEALFKPFDTNELNARLATIAANGFNLGSHTKTGTCKTTQDWKEEFDTLKKFAGSDISVKLFTTSDCNTLDNVIPAAKETKTQIWAGVWAVDDAKFAAEKAALWKAVQAHGVDWLVGINVGSESLYRKEIKPEVLAERIYDIKGLIQIAGKFDKIPVGSADTWSSWEDGANAPVAKACDVILMNAFPYWQGAKIEDALGKLETAIKLTKEKTGNKPFVVGETGWPTKGPNFGDATATVENSQKYWKAAACFLKKEKIPRYWFSGFDEPQKTGEIEQNFGIATADRQPKIDFTC